MGDKALLVMGMPENGCADCSICRESFLKTICGITGNCVSGNRERGGFPEECPLKPVPERRNGVEYLEDIFQHPAFDYGWNACVDKILEECKDEKD
ncbi:MAG: hypothetical protein SOX32_12915 [Candidatus Choladocola sp.]|nr:hypothetical protein [Candidatus Choladocola sp.]